jgi:hypothetical protein
MPEPTLLEKIVLGEVEGKHKAIHAYDAMMWKIRTGFLTLLFGGWAILLKGLAEDICTHRPREYVALVLGLLLFSGGFAVGAWIIDRNYLQRKFRVIFALNRLLEEVRSSGGDLMKVSPDLLKIAGDNADMPFEGRGYRNASLTELSVYLAPLAILAAALLVILPWPR